MEDYITWDFSSPGISFSINSGRITIFKTTLVAMDYPEFFHFLFSPENLVFGIEPCRIDDGGAHRLPDERIHDYYDFKSIDLVRFVYQSCGWKKKLTYRVPGVRQAPDDHTVYFDLRKALEVHEGRTKAVDQSVIMESAYENSSDSGFPGGDVPVSSEWETIRSREQVAGGENLCQ